MKAFVGNSRWALSPRGALSLGLAVGLSSAPVGAATFTWSGTVSTNWSDGGNWVGGIAPTSAPVTDVVLNDAGVYRPSHQNIEGLSIRTLVFTNLHDLVVRGRELVLDSVVQLGPVSGTNTLACDIRLSGSTAWRVGGNHRVILAGSVGETGGSRSLAANDLGTIELRGANTFSGGLKNNQAAVVFYGPHNLGTLPAALVTNFFESGFGGWFAATTGGFSRVVLPSRCGLRSTGNPSLCALRDVKLVVPGPITGLSLEQGYNSEGTIVLTGTNTLSSNVTIRAGTVVLGHPSGFGVGGVGARVTLIGSLDLNGQDLTSRDVGFVNGSGDSGSGQLKNNDTRRASTVVGTCNLGGGAGGSALQFGGNGEIVLSGCVFNAGTAFYSLLKIGDGTLTLKGTNTYVAPTVIRGGGLTLDYSAYNTRKLSTNNLFLAQATLRMIGTESGPSTESVATIGVGTYVNEVSGASTILLEPSATQDLTLAVTGLVVASTHTLELRTVPSGLGQALITVVTNPPGLFAGAGATWNRRTWATIVGNVVTGLGDAAYQTVFEGGSTNTHVDVPAGSTNLVGTLTHQTLRFRAAEGSTVTIGSGARLKLHGLNGSAPPHRPGILMTADAGPVTLASVGTGEIDLGLNQVLYIHQYSTHPLTLSARIGAVGSGNQIFKCGPGELILTATNNTMGSPTHVFGGTLTIHNIKEAGTPSAIGTHVRLNLANATLRYLGPGETHDRWIYLRGPGTLDASGTGPWVFASVTNITRSVGTDHDLTLTGTGDGVLRGVLDLLFGGVIKEGTGRWTLCGSQSYRGPTIVTNGTLVLSNNCALARSLYVGPNGTLAGSGWIGEDLVVHGTRRMAIRGDADYDTLAVQYDATLNGRLEIVLEGEYKPNHGQPFTVVTAGGELATNALTCSRTDFRILASPGALIAEYRGTRGTLFIVR